VRRDIARYAAPAAFLVAATVAIVLIRAGLNAEDGNAEPPAPPPVTTAATEPRVTTASTPPVRPARYTTVESGETLGTIADEFDTTVESIVELNPGVDPSALQVGQRIRVR
jgi:LysM repeat protein